MQSTVSAGAASLQPTAASGLTTALLQSQQRGGGFCGLDGQPDLYYTFFARLSLIALGAEFDRQSLISWLKEQLGFASGVDRVCAELILLQEGERSRAAALIYLLGSLCRVGMADSYKLFLTAFMMEELLPRWLNRFLINRAAATTLKQRAHTDFTALSTPRAALCALLAHSKGDQSMQQRMGELMPQRHLSSGGYSSAFGAKADLLSTAVVLYTGRVVKGTEAQAAPLDLAFVELCWQDDGLFSSAPDQPEGDLEHTFYALLALGSACH